MLTAECDMTLFQASQLPRNKRPAVRKDTPPKNTASAGIIPGEDDVRQAVAVLYETALRGTGQLNAGCSIATEPGCTVRTPGIAKTVYISSFKLLGCSPERGTGWFAGLPSPSTAD